MENLIAIEGKEKYQYKDTKSLIEKFINKNYFDMSKEERKIELEKKTVANTMLNHIKVITLEKETENFDEDAFILYDEITYILSMLKFNKIILLEKTDANIFGKYLNKKYINKENIKDNYIIINKFANEIMKKYLKNS